jgi:hypothetical protein
LSERRGSAVKNPDALVQQAVRIFEGERDFGIVAFRFGRIRNTLTAQPAAPCAKASEDLTGTHFRVS